MKKDKKITKELKELFLSKRKTKTIGKKPKANVKGGIKSLYKLI